MAATPRPEVVRAVTEVYPLVVNRRYARVELFQLAHQRLRAWARALGEDEEEWPDMALRLMLEYERGE